MGLRIVCLTFCCAILRYLHTVYGMFLLRRWNQLKSIVIIIQFSGSTMSLYWILSKLYNLSSTIYFCWITFNLFELYSLCPINSLSWRGSANISLSLRLNFYIMVIDFFHWIELSINIKIENKISNATIYRRKDRRGQLSKVKFHIFFIYVVAMDG